MGKSSTFFAFFWNMPKTGLDLYVAGVQRPILDFWRNLSDSENSPYFNRFLTISPKVIFDPKKCIRFFDRNVGFDQDGSQVHLHLPACSVKMPPLTVSTTK